jgi:predicted nucleotidyltransferase
MPDLAIEIDKDKLRAFCRQWKITEFALFGSAVQPAEFDADSDVDVGGCGRSVVALPIRCFLNASTRRAKLHLMPELAIEIDETRLRDFCRKWKITEFALFGSAVRPEEFRDDSDVDVLVRFAEDAEWSLFDHVNLQDDLRDIFERDVDVLTRPSVERSLNRFRRDSILSSAVQLDVA